MNAPSAFRVRVLLHLLDGGILYCEDLSKIANLAVCSTIASKVPKTEREKNIEVTMCGYDDDAVCVIEAAQIKPHETARILSKPLIH
jgi:hypothetical protein